MKLKSILKIKDREEAREIAMAFQEWFGKHKQSYSELVEFGEYFDTLAEKFNLSEEFKENGIISNE